MCSVWISGGLVVSNGSAGGRLALAGYDGLEFEKVEL